VVSRTEMRGFKDGNAWFQGRKCVVSRTEIASPQSWDNVYNIIFNIIIKDDVLTTTTTSTEK
jgi:hypothetical protein